MDTGSFGAWEPDVRIYCQQNKLSFEKAKALYKCWGIDFLKLKPYKSASAPVALIVSRNKDGSGRCEPTEYTKRYLA